MNVLVFCVSFIHRPVIQILTVFLLIFLIFFNVIALGGLYSLYLFQQFTVLIIIFVYWTQLFKNTGHTMELHVMNYISFLGLLLPIRTHVSPHSLHAWAINPPHNLRSYHI